MGRITKDRRPPGTKGTPPHDRSCAHFGHNRHGARVSCCTTLFAAEDQMDAI
jgi:hypothetical protein